MVALSILKGDFLRKTERPFTKTCSDKARSNHLKLKEGKFRLGIRKKFFLQ